MRTVDQGRTEAQAEPERARATVVAAQPIVLRAVTLEEVAAMQARVDEIVEDSRKGAGRLMLADPPSAKAKQGDRP